MRIDDLDCPGRLVFPGRQTDALSQGETCLSNPLYTNPTPKHVTPSHMPRAESLLRRRQQGQGCGENVFISMIISALHALAYLILVWGIFGVGALILSNKRPHTCCKLIDGNGGLSS